MRIEETIYRRENLKKYNKYFSFLEKTNENYNLVETLPDHVAHEYFKDEEVLLKEISEIDNEYSFIERIKSYETLNKSLSNAKIDLFAYKIFYNKEENSTTKSTLKSFKPFQGLSSNITYNFCGNVTGRLVVKKGPRILTLPKKYRSLIESSFIGGKIISADFSSLEPRLCLKLTGKDTSSDLYEEINSILNLNLNRSVIKKAIISVLYGSHFSSLEEISRKKAEILFNCIKEYFKLGKILEISKNIDNHGIRRNYLGRPLWNLEEKRENILINNYVQSSAVDISLTYFTHLINKVDCLKAKPLFILHDAIIFDVSKEYESCFKEIISQGYSHEKLGMFPLKTEIFNSK